MNTQMNTEVHVRKLEDNLAEANSRLAEMEKSHTELNAAKIRLSGTDRLHDAAEHQLGLRLIA